MTNGIHEVLSIPQKVSKGTWSEKRRIPPGGFSRTTTLMKFFSLDMAAIVRRFLKISSTDRVEVDLRGDVRPCNRPDHPVRARFKPDVGLVWYGCLCERMSGESFSLSLSTADLDNL